MDTCALLLHYNNYFNRTIKRLETKNEYQAADHAYGLCNHINFNPGDGITTSHVFGFGSNQTSLFDGKEYDYLVIYDGSDSDHNYPIVSRWFIMEAVRTREGQYELTLHRDVIADNYDTVLKSTAYIEKGYLTPSNPLIYNKEGLLVNQIKKEEILLQDASRSPWIVGYIPKNKSLENTTIDYAPANKDYISLGVSDISNWEYAQYQSTLFKGAATNLTYKVWYQIGELAIYRYNGMAAITSEGGWSGHHEGLGNKALRTSWWSSFDEMAEGISNTMNSMSISRFNTAFDSYFNTHASDATAAFLAYNGKVVKTTTGKYYKVAIYNTGIHEAEADIASGNDLFNLLSTAVQNSGKFTTGYTTPDDHSFSYSCQYQTYSMVLTEIEAMTVVAKISSTRRHTDDALYDIFCMPYSDNVRITDNDEISFYNKHEIADAAATALATALGTAGIYDIQLLPYCPVQDCLTAAGDLILPGEETIGYDLIKDNSEDANPIGVIIYPTQCNFTFNISNEISWSRSKYINGFNTITVPSGSSTYSFWEQNTDYVIINLETEQQLDPPGPDTNWYNYIESVRRVTFSSTKLIDGLNIKKISKTDGTVLDEFRASQIATYTTGTPANDYIEINSTAGQIEQYSRSDYENGSWYYCWSCVEGKAYANSTEGGQIILDMTRFPIYEYRNSESIDIKLDNECNMYRIVSPNYQGDFEFSLVKNQGVSFFNVDCTYKPHNPYIHINPDFKNMYGRDFDDGRGLICQGDFSYGLLSDAFTNYELNNKNYNAIFNRQIKNMDVNNAIARQEQLAQTIAGGVTGTASGVAAGAIAGGVPGAIIGGVAGASLSTFGGVLDYQNLIKRQEEARSFATDMYNYSLQNIKALPYSLTSCTALTYNNKLFPFVEKYSCTAQEREAVLNKLLFDGMTVNKIDTLENYVSLSGKMIRGEIIRYNSSQPLKGDTHIADAIYNEIKKGVYW